MNELRVVSRQLRCRYSSRSGGTTTSRSLTANRSTTTRSGSKHSTSTCTSPRTGRTIRREPTVSHNSYISNGRSTCALLVRLESESIGLQQQPRSTRVYKYILKGRVEVEVGEGDKNRRNSLEDCPNRVLVILRIRGPPTATALRSQDPIAKLVCYQPRYAWLGAPSAPPQITPLRCVHGFRSS